MFAWGMLNGSTPMAARRTESEAFIWARVSGGQGSFLASRAAPPMRASFHSISNPCFLATACALSQWCQRRASGSRRGDPEVEVAA